MQFAFLLMLIGALGAGVLVLASMGLAQARRRSSLARAAHEMGMRFSARDPFNLVRRYSRFVLTLAGHSPHAENVIYGRYRGWNLRAFDYRFEAGHGTRRLVRRYSVIAADTDLFLPSVLLWRAEDAEHVPLAVHEARGRLGSWLVVSDAQWRPVLAEAFRELLEQPVNVQLDDHSALLCSAARWKAGDFAARMDQAARALEVLRARWKRS